MMNDPANEISEFAPTLEDLRKLPKDLKGRLLLPRLVKIRRQNFDALNKHNLLLPTDNYGLGFGYPAAENMAVREHLLGAPWTWLVNEGYIVDVTGDGFFNISDDGKDFLAKKDTSPRPDVTPDPGDATGSGAAKAPKAFISYSWEGPEHRDWVTEFAGRLRADGVDVIFDRWDLHPGQDRLHFMEQAVAKSDFVIVVCTEDYARRADNREGGVGYESMVITGQMAENILANKFIPVLRQGSFRTSLPIYLKSRLGVDLSGEPEREDEYERLLRVLHGEPLQAPPLGSKPDFTKKSSSPKTGGTVVDAAVKALTGSSGDNLPLGPPTQRPNGIAYARYDKPGYAGAWITATVRLWEIGGKPSYSFETMKVTN